MICIWLSIPHITGEQAPPTSLIISATIKTAVTAEFKADPVEESIKGGFGTTTGYAHTVLLYKPTPSLLTIEDRNTIVRFSL